MNSLLFFTVLIGCFAGLNALSCHSCSYSSFGGQDDCVDTFTGNYTTSCSSSQDTCLKTMVKISGDVTTMTRSCSDASSCTEQCASIFSIQTCTYCCTTDDCNGAGAMTFSLVTMVATVLGAYMAQF